MNELEKEKEKDNPKNILELLKKHNISKCDILTKTKRNIKGKLKFDEFINMMNTLLSNIDKNELTKYDHNLVLFTIESIEHVFTEKKSGDIKRAVVVEILKPYFNDDTDLVIKFVELLLPKIEKSTWYTRHRNIIKSFFFVLVCMFRRK